MAKNKKTIDLTTDISSGTRLGTGAKVSKESVRDDAALRERVAKQVEKDKAARAEKARKREPIVALVRTGVAALLAVSAVGMGVYLVSTSGGYDEELRTGNATIAELKDRNVSLDRKTELVSNPEALRNGMDEARARGEALADLQNQIRDYDFNAEDQQNVENWQALVDKARGYIAKESLVGGDLAPHGIWYQPYVLGEDEHGRAAYVRMGSELWSWSYIPGHNVAVDGNVPVMFEARVRAGDEEGKLLAWMFASYDVSTGLFHDFILGVTEAGNSHNGATATYDSPESPTPETMARIGQQLRELARQRAKEAPEGEPGDAVVTDDGAQRPGLMQPPPETPIAEEPPATDE